MVETSCLSCQSVGVWDAAGCDQYQFGVERRAVAERQLDWMFAIVWNRSRNDLGTLTHIPAPRRDCGECSRDIAIHRAHHLASDQLRDLHPVGMQHEGELCGNDTAPDNSDVVW